MFKKVILTISGHNLDEIKKVITKVDKDNKLILMYGFQSEPTRVSDNNLSKIRILKNRFIKHQVAFMDHTKGDNDFALYVPLIAIGCGALGSLNIYLMSDFFTTEEISNIMAIEGLIVGLFFIIIALARFPISKFFEN